ncbi:MAG: 5-formyltetrahydrofolate cyclo-ligase [Endomicrobium sp.]|jgi:5-formyltetrahydrofolate cyclo-ligase|nr:5-formyltetrahydrofolate cyclo-ligase [Endomicrobium sp.]
MNDYLESEKIKIRRKFLKLRNRTNPVLIASYSVNIFTKVRELSIYKKAKVVMFYLSCGSEVFTDFMINFAFDEGKTVVVPAIKTSQDIKMYAVKILKLEDACYLVYSIRQPEMSSKNIIEKDRIDLFFVPAIVFNTEGYRAGYGKGYYDRWLKNVPFDRTVGLAYDFQIADKIPVREYDIPVSVIVTEKRVIKV